MSFLARDNRQPDLFAPAVEPEVDEEHEGYLAVGVWPTDCRNTAGLRPCPYPVSCRHHLLFDEVFSSEGAPSLAINRATDARLVQIQTRGRREELEAHPGPGKIAGFIEVAIERLWELPDTCSREVARRAHLATEDNPGEPAMTFPEIALVLGVADPDELAEEFADLRAGLRGEAIEAGADPDTDEAIASLTRPG